MTAEGWHWPEKYNDCWDDFTYREDGGDGSAVNWTAERALSFERVLLAALDAGAKSFLWDEGRFDTQYARQLYSFVGLAMDKAQPGWMTFLEKEK